MKKLSILLVLITLLAVIVSCSTNEKAPENDKNDTDINKNENVNNEDNKNDIDFSPTFEFVNFEEFMSYAKDTENQTLAIKPEAIIDFSSIINSKCSEICLLNSYNYFFIYGEHEDYDYVVGIYVTVYPELETVPSDWYLNSNIENEIPYSSINDIDQTTDGAKYFSIQGNEFVYYVSRQTGKYNAQIIFPIDNFLIEVKYDAGYGDLKIESHGEIVTSLNPDYGATDDTVIAMLNKIKALIPKS